jgi:hypothetical protein
MAVAGRARDPAPRDSEELRGRARNGCAKEGRVPCARGLLALATAFACAPGDAGAHT